MANNQLKMNLKQHGLNISGSTADLLNEFSATHVEDEEFINNSCEDDTASESESSDSDVENMYVEESFGVFFAPEEDIQHVN